MSTTLTIKDINEAEEAINKAILRRTISNANSIHSTYKIEEINSLAKVSDQLRNIHIELICAFKNEGSLSIEFEQPKKDADPFRRRDLKETDFDFDFDQFDDEPTNDEDINFSDFSEIEIEDPFAVLDDKEEQTFDFDSLGGDSDDETDNKDNSEPPETKYEKEERKRSDTFYVVSVSIAIALAYWLGGAA